MATHNLWINRMETVENARLGNSMSTTISFKKENRTLSVHWKGRTTFSGNIPEDVECVSVKCSGGAPDVVLMKPPKNPIAAAAWRRRFYASRRRGSADEVSKEWEDEGGRWYPVAKLIQTPTFAFAWRPAMDGNVGVPLCWWASSTAAAAEIEMALERAIHGDPDDDTDVDVSDVD